MLARFLHATLRSLRASRVWKIAAVSVFLYAAGDPGAPAGAEGPLQFFLQQQGQGDQTVRSRPAPAPARPARKQERDFMPAEATRTPDAPGGTPVAPTFFINVIGDSLAVLTADGLTQAFADRPEIGVIGRARESSGLVRDDYYDWLKTAGDLAAAKAKLDFVVVILGINDMQPLKDGAETLDPLSDKWREIYDQRIERLVAPFKAAHVPVAWVGLPPMRSERFNAQVVKLNELFKEKAEEAGAHYVDIWDAFANQDGDYDAFGPDINGQTVKLRSSDGIHFTKAGARKLAQFLETDIKRAFESVKPPTDIANLPPDIEQTANDINAQIRREMGVGAAPGEASPAEPEKPLAGPILPLTARPISPGGALATRASASRASVSVERVLALGAPLAPKPGRADDFGWPRL
jgi:hypothetical protein